MPREAAQFSDLILLQDAVVTSLTLAQQYQAYLDKSTPYTTYRWVGTAALLLIFLIRIVIAQGWYIGTYSQLQPCHLSSQMFKGANPS